MTSQITTADQLAAAGDIGRCELIRGQLHMMTPASYEHGRIVINITVAISNHVKSNALGVVVAAETGFVIERNPDTVRAADVAFIAADRAPEPGGRGFGTVIPDLVVEVNSPDDRAGEVLDKVQQWLAAGVKLVWVVDPKTKTITAHQPDGHAEVLSTEHELTAPNLLPGFKCTVATVFE